MHALSRCLFYLLIALSVSGLQAQDKAPVDVSRVQFNSSTRPFKWNNVVIELQANENPDPKAPNPRYVDEIRVIVTLGYKSDGSDGFTFYQSEATLITLQVGKKKDVAFWMPYDVVERDNLPKEPEYWIVELEVKGQAVDQIQNSSSFSSKFTGRASIENFKNMSRSKLGDTEGILVPTYLSPNPPIDTREPAAFIRKEQQ